MTNIHNVLGNVFFWLSGEYFGTFKVSFQHKLFSGFELVPLTPLTYCDDYDQYVYRVIITVCSTCVFSKDGESLQGSQVELQTIHWFSQSRRMVSIEVIELSIRRRP